MNNQVKLGVSARSPIGDGCIVRFEGIEIMDNNYINIRNLIKYLVKINKM